MKRSNFALTIITVLILAVTAFGKPQVRVVVEKTFKDLPLDFVRLEAGRMPGHPEIMVVGKVEDFECGGAIIEDGKKVLYVTMYPGAIGWGKLVAIDTYFIVPQKNDKLSVIISSKTPLNAAIKLVLIDDDDSSRESPPFNVDITLSEIFCSYSDFVRGEPGKDGVFNENKIVRLGVVLLNVSEEKEEVFYIQKIFWSQEQK